MPLFSPVKRVGLWLAARLLRAWASTWRVVCENADLEAHCLAEGPAIYAFWHEYLFVLGLVHRDRNIVGVVSQSRDGAQLSTLLARLGYGLVRGSTSRGARAVARQCLRCLEDGHSVALAVDGPRGPRRVAAPGATFLARVGKRPLLAVRADAAWVVRLPTWDKQAIALPFSRVSVRYSLASPEAVVALEHQLNGDSALAEPPQHPAAEGLSAPILPES